MVKFLKSGKVAVILNGRHAGKKAVIVKNSKPTDAFESFLSVLLQCRCSGSPGWNFMHTFRIRSRISEQNQRSGSERTAMESMRHIQLDKSRSIPRVASL
ncbi:hypothetical protein BGX31_000883 [Mortierella sp. GBA43]|nr:hypothetical protein BGX31_000883 [Mortierella sp. GBA43]